MLTGSEPDKQQARAIEQYLISTIDHGFNASTFTARVIASTGADVAACMVGAVGALSGPLHGGAPSRALDTLDAIGTPDRIDSWIRERVLAGDRIMGFGHPIYRTEDPRSRMLREIAQQFGGPRVEFAVEVERQVEAILAELKPGRELHTNVEFYAGLVMELCGLPREMFTPTFAAARVVGWSANVVEQAEDSKIIRPVARYVGVEAPVAVPLMS
jgi:citrate synthase